MNNGWKYGRTGYEIIQALFFSSFFWGAKRKNMPLDQQAGFQISEAWHSDEWTDKFSTARPAFDTSTRARRDIP